MKRVRFFAGELYMEKNQTLNLSIDAFSSDGSGIARQDGMVVFVKNALPGECVTAKILSVKKKFAFAKAEVAISEPSDIRTDPPCPHFHKCGGCDLQHVVYSAQLKVKRDTVCDCLHKAGIDAAIEDTVPSDKITRYRNKMSLPVRSDNGKCRIGLFARGSHRIIECDDCLLQPEWNRQVIRACKKFMEISGYKAYDEVTGKGDVRHIVAREVAGILYITIVATRKIDIGALPSMLAQDIDDFCLYLNINTQNNNVILGDKWIKVYGEERPALIEGLKAEIHPAGFFQVNDYIRSAIYSAVKELVYRQRADLVVDAYSGAGIMTAMLAPFAGKVVGIEINTQASLSAKKLMADNGITNMETICSDVKDNLSEALDGNGKKIVVLDPPRSGAGREVIDCIAEKLPETLIYISCDPGTLARDMSLLSEHYTPSLIRPYDMFPMTKHVETLVCLTRK